ncbi:MAG: hypothetical protein HY928_16585 [Elusimicrobia bacterium]|nr:hypothetical protein [Elusimicrobiota bacterium]
MLALALAAALAVPAAAASAGAYTAVLTLDPGGALRVVETFRPADDPAALCGPLRRDLPTKRLGFDGLRRLLRVRVTGVFRGTGLGLSPAGWSLERRPRGTRLSIGPAPAPPDCAVTLLYEAEPILTAVPAGVRLSFPLPGPEWGERLAGAAVSLSGSSAPARLAQAGAAAPLAEGQGGARAPGALELGKRVVFSIDLPAGAAPLPAPSRRRLLAENLHAAVGAAGLALVILFYLLRPALAGGRWGLCAAGAALSAGTVAAMRLAEDPSAVTAPAALWALGAGAAAAALGLMVLACWGATVVLLRSASREGAPRPLALSLGSLAMGFVSFGTTTLAADLFTRLIRDAAPAAAACAAAHLALHGGALLLSRRTPPTP